MKTIIATTNFSETATNAVLFAADMALKVHARLQIYHAVPDRVVLIDDLDYDVEYADTEEAMQQLEALQEKIKRYTQYQLSIDVQLKHGNINSVLEGTCKQTVPFAVVMSATEKNALERFWAGSETLAISNKIQAPLLVVPQQAEFKDFKKIAIAADLHRVYDTIPLDNLTNLIEAFKPLLEIVFVKENDRFEAENVSEAVALQTHFAKYSPSFRYIKSDNITNGLNKYLSESRPDLLIMIPKKHTPFHKSISKQFIIHPGVPTMIITGYH